MRMETVVIEKSGLSRKAALVWESCAAAGYTGRNQESVRAHVEELRKLGVPAPAKVPMMYWIEPARVTDRSELWVVGGSTSGEGEVFLARTCCGRLVVMPASEHTDRAIEKVSVSKAKQVCTKVVAPVAWLVDEIRDHWDEIELKTFVDGELYQSGKLGQMLEPEKLMELAGADSPLPEEPYALFSGTLPILGGETVFGQKWELSLTDPVLGREIKMAYTVRQLPDRN